MIKIFSLSAIIIFLTSSSSSHAQTYTQGYTRQNGTYLVPHFSSSPNGTNKDNYATQGNTNPFTGSSGSRAPDYSSATSRYGSGREIQTGRRGGQYYVNSNGKKTYVPKR
jgi:hypothetical protein